MVCHACLWANGPRGQGRSQVRTLPEALAALGREVLELVPRTQRASLAAYRQAANDLSAILRVTGARSTTKTQYYAALRVKWLADNTTIATT